MKKKKIKRRDFIAKELLTSGKYTERIIPNKKKKVKKFNWKQIKNDLSASFLFCEKFYA